MNNKLIGRTSVRDNIKLSEDPSYPIFKELYEKQKKVVWFPEELNIQQDALDYHSLTDDEKELFDTAVGYFCSSELLVQNVLVNSFFPLLTDPHAKMSFSTQLFMENIHSDFFEIVLQSFGLDREKMYDVAFDDPILRKKQDLIVDEIDKISHGKINPETLKGQKQVLRAILLNNIVLEGIFFYSSFAHFFALKDMAKMKNVVSGVELVLIDESLHLQNGIEAILIMLEENPEIVEDTEYVQDIRNVILDGTSLEIEYVKHQFGDRTILGISSGEMERYLKYITDRRLQELGFQQEFHINENPLRFLQKEDVKKLINFFEVSSTEYTNY
ncbi:ribonucleoside-diphosphate reductase beta chain [Fodinibius salinus]|uniref:Ribonucleoside-diphosphate reductase subunit beta n=1 Tax=Fodinibius salinus TaxID=860790 RepID=A0A5D3YGB8_9BACT|nr:ribonucleotide-diphosphate reductase subunit beta [Fodinibius salinus]TYP92168.1 ribonucleoside-diphosphate reductase beta chain [Fodinibius salinus]